jgi:hypothetical protein
MSAAVTAPFLVHRKVQVADLVIVRLELNLFQIEDYIRHVFNDVGECLKFVLRTADFHRGDRRSLQRAEQDTAQRVADGVTIAGFKRFGDKLGVNRTGARIFFDERLGHFETA